MKYFSAIFCASLILLSLGFAKDIELGKEEQISIIYNSQVYNLDDNPVHQNPNQSREQIDLIVEDFEGEHGWAGDGWNLTDQNYNSEMHSENSPNDATTQNGNWNLLSPTLALPELGDGESMHFDFFLNVDMPDNTQQDDPDTPDDESSYLADYYSVSLLDLGALAWHASETGSFDGSSFWSADEELGGYLDSWIQYLDTPSISVGSAGNLDAKIFYAIESDAGAVVAGSCTDGWDAANIRISTDGGATWALLEDSSNPYHFTCGYGWIWNDAEYDTNGSLNHLASGWGNQSTDDDGDGDGWLDFSADLSGYEGQDVIIRFAFGSDPAYSTPDDSSITGFKVDEISVSDDSGVLFSDGGNDMSAMVSSGEVWTDQFYDYFDDTADNERPGSLGWEQYLPNMAFNGNIFLDISDFAGKDVIFRIQSRYDDNDFGGAGTGLFIDDFRVYKESGGSHPTPTGLTAESGDSEVTLSWNDMNGAGTDDFDYTNGEPTTGIQMSTSGSTAWAGERIDLVGASTINTVSVHLGPNTVGSTTTLAVFGTLGALFNNVPMHTQDITLGEGWTDFDLDLDMTNGYIIAQQFTNVDDTPDGVYASLDETATPSTNSMVLFSGGGWDIWSVAGATVGDGEWGIRANISYEGAGVTYNLYRDGDATAVASGLDAAMHTDTGLVNNQEYYYQVTATYEDGEESDYSEVVTVTPFSNTVHEVANDDGTAEDLYNAGSGNFTAVKYTACSQGELINRFKWYQTEDAGALYVKLYADEDGLPGAEEYSAVVVAGDAGWNEKDLLSQSLVVSGDFWIGMKEFSSTRPIGLDTSSDDAEVSYSRIGSTGEWTVIPGNLMIRALLDEADCSGEPECTPGDTNDDGGVDVLDVVAVVNNIINGTPVDCADMNGDDGVDVLDVVAMVNLIING